MADATSRSWIDALPEPEQRAAAARARLGAALGFKDCTGAVLDELVALSTLRPVQRGEFVLRRGDPADSVLMVVSGMLENSKLKLNLNGSRQLVGLLMPGDFAGLLGVVDGQPHVNDSVARHDTLLMSVSTEAMRDLRRREPSLVLACEQQLAFRSRLLYARLAADPGVPLKARVATLLLILCELYGQPGEGGSIDLKLSQSDLADWLGMSRQRVNFVLKQLQGDGLLALSYVSIRVVDLEGLRDCAQA